jgi:hypothetical protein
VTFKTAGSQTLTATDTASSALTGTSNGIATGAAAATHFVLVVPANVTAGSPFTVTVTAQDAFDNLATGYTGAVHFTSSDARAALPADNTLSNGVGTFAMTLGTAGSETVTATDTAHSALTGTSSGIAVGAAAATHLVLIAPTSATAGSGLVVTVTAEDAYGNTATDETGIVDFTCSDGAASLPPDAPLSSGVGSFGVTLRAAGRQTVTATVGSITGTSNRITVAAAAATHFSVAAPAAATAGSSFTVTVTALDPFNNTATGYTGTVHLTSSDRLAALPADSTLANGTGTFSATLRTAGSQTLTATDAASGSLTGSSADVPVAAAGADHFTASAPAAATAGSPFTVTVTALDAFGNTATGYRGTVRLTSNDARAVLPASGGLPGGVGTFTVTLKTSGGWTLTATDTASGSLTASSAAIPVAAAAADHFAVRAPATATAGGAITVTVTARDPFGNTATGYTGTIHFSSSDGQAGLPADGTLNGGVGTFSVVPRTAGSQTVTATDTAGSGLTGSSAAIAVDAAAASRLVIGTPATATPGLFFLFTVTAQDPFGNQARGYLGTVHFSSSDPQASLPLDWPLSSGLGTFVATLKTIGNETLTATDRFTSSITGTSASVAVGDVAATTTTITQASPATPTVGEPVTLTATVTPAFGTGEPTGTVDFRDGRTPLGSAPLLDVGGVATATFPIAVAQLGAGPHTLIAVYNPGTDRIHTTSTSADFSLPVDPAATTPSSPTSGPTMPVGTPAAGAPPAETAGPGQAFSVRVVRVRHRPQVQVRGADGARRFAFFPYGRAYHGGVHVVLADVNGDGFPDLVVTPRAGARQPVRVFDGRTGSRLRIDGPTLAGLLAAYR